MNYRHAYHAGNIGDVLKHIVLMRIIEHLKIKPAGFRVIDTHAGIGLYDLTSQEAQKTGEWRDGVGRLLAGALPPDITDLISPWREVIDQRNPAGILKYYPGSPELAARLMRPQDRLVATELHDADFAVLSRHFSRDKRVKTVHLDGWLAVKSFVPPKEKRGLVLIDPPFESEHEFSQMAQALLGGIKRWSNGIFALWYPVKKERECDRFFRTIQEAGIRKVLRLTLGTDKPHADGSMRTSGMIVVNPPWHLKEQMGIILPFLARKLGDDHKGIGLAEWLVGE